MSFLDDLISPIVSVLDAEEAEACEQSFAEFFIRCWPIIDPGTPLVWGYPMDAIADHLQAVDDGHIRRLLITIFPGASKSSLTNVAYPAWSWLRRPHLRFIGASYSEGLTRRDNDRCRRIISSEWYQHHWGNRFKLVAPNRPDKFENDKTGWKLATSVGGELLGHRGNVIILDDPNSPKVESEAVRTTTNRWFKEVVPSRFNNMEQDVLIVIQQRMHLEDVAGIALGLDEEWVHCNIPMEYEPRPYVNGYKPEQDNLIHTFYDIEAQEVPAENVFWRDWRTYDGELAWPARFPRVVVENMKKVLGPTATNSQLQQHPVPRGGAIIKSDWWQIWPEEPFPPLEYIVASLDTAYTKDTNADPSALTVWGVNHDQFNNPRIFLLWAWQEWLEMHELVEKVIDTCTVDKRVVAGQRFPVHKLLIEDAASGKSVGQELDRLFRQRTTFGVELIPPRLYGDKVARLYSVEHIFAARMVYAHDRTWSQQVIDQCASVPFTSHDDLSDTVAQAIRWLRDCGFTPTKEEAQEMWLAERQYQRKLPPLYPC